MRERYRVVVLLLKPSLSLFGLVGQRWVLLPHPGSATGHLIAPGDHYTLQHIQVHFGVDLETFSSPWARPCYSWQSRFVFWGCWLWSSWIGREHGCTAAHLRSRSLNIVSLSDMIEGSYHSWNLYTTGQLVDGLQRKKKKTIFIKRKWNHVFSRATILSFHPADR